MKEGENQTLLPLKGCASWKRYFYIPWWALWLNMTFHCIPYITPKHFFLSPKSMEGLGSDLPNTKKKKNY